ncbi:PhoX domain-containing protein [Auriscalpium vulgare]|uniref:PhoX domain-containing protein n=1 Tax=Auriscalpium vulgare TaxID=40419 RepID=A0ACB8RRW2_9AGAM|nr:PhoX domain-containing protein [Auriscalpium vulgare]
MQSLNTSTVVLVAVFAVFLPIAVRVISSPLALILLSPFLVVSFVLSLITLNVLLGHLLDAKERVIGLRYPAPARPLAFSTPAAWQAVLIRSQWAHRPPHSLPDLYPESPMISTAVNDILILIVRDFVLSWYKDLSSSPSFPTAVSATLHSSMNRLLARLSSADLSTILVKRLLPIITAHVEQFRESEVALRGAGLERRLTESEELDMLLASRYAGKSGTRLHTAVNNLSSSFTKQSEEAHLKQLIEKVLPLVLPEKEARSSALKVVVREIAACSVLYPVMDMFADPDFWNRTIGQLAGAAIRQQRLITKVRNVLEAQLPHPKPRLATARTSVTDTITIRTDAKHFESFLRSISHTSSLLDARRLKNDIMGEIRRTRVLLANHEREDWINGEKTEDVVAFLDRLYTAKRQAELRIAVLGGNDDTSSLPDAPASRLNLRDILGNPSSLSYFMEFLDRRNRALLAQFWLTVESFKNPLESFDSGSSDNEDDPIHDPSLASTAKEDIAMIYELYFSSSSPHPALSAISAKHVSAIRGFSLSETMPSSTVERKARRSVMLAQRQVEQTMEQDFEDFERSELWFRVVEDINASRGAPRDTSVRGRGALSASTEALPAGGRVASPAPMLRTESLPSFILPLSPSAQSSYAESLFPISPMESSQISLPRPPSNLDVLMSPLPEADTSSRAPLFDDPDDNTKNSHESQSTVEAIQAALTDIIALDKQQTDKRATRPYLTTANSVLDSSPDPSLFVDGPRGLPLEDIDEEETAEANADAKQENFQLAGPGDLQLSYEIARLSDKIYNLQTQEAMLDTLIKKAELTGDAQELRLLRRSKSAMSREYRELSFQRSQYEQQEIANRLVPDRTKLTIVNSVVGDEGGRSVVRYLVEVQQLGLDGSVTTGWVVARRYNEFLNMHNKLRERYALVRVLDFPGKRLVTSLSGSFVDTRRAALEKYVQNLIQIPAVCESEELRAFLSRNSPFIVSEPEPTASKAGGAFPGTGLVRNVYHSVAGSIDDMFFGPSMLDVMIQRLTRQAAELAGIVGNSINDEDVVAQALRASGKTASDDTLLQFSGDLKPLEGETSSSTFSAPICDLVLAIFELNKKNNWLRRQAIVIIMQQVLGSTVERKLRETVSYLTDEPHIMNFINMFRDALWSGGQLRTQSTSRSPEEKLRARDDANRMLSALMPGERASSIGEEDTDTFRMQTLPLT